MANAWYVYRPIYNWRRDGEDLGISCTFLSTATSIPTYRLVVWRRVSILHVMPDILASDSNKFSVDVQTDDAFRSKITCHYQSDVTNVAPNIKYILALE